MLFSFSFLFILLLSFLSLFLSFSLFFSLFLSLSLSFSLFLSLFFLSRPLFSLFSLSFLSFSFSGSFSSFVNHHFEIGPSAAISATEVFPAVRYIYYNSILMFLTLLRRCFIGNFNKWIPGFVVI